MEENVRITVDSREGDTIKRYRKYFKEEHDIEIKVDTLPVGDLLIVNTVKQVIFERKSFEDFVQSVRSGHLTKQLLQQDQFPYSYLIVVGQFRDAHFNPHLEGWTTEHHLGTLASILVRHKTKIIFVDNLSQYFALAKRIFDKTEDGKILSLENTELMKNKMNVEDFKVKMLCSLPGVSIKIANKLREKCVVKILNKEGKEITEEELKEIEGIGDKKAKEISKIFK